MAEKMFCYQCEQTAKGQGCNISGVCGKTPDVAALQDLLVYALRGLSLYAVEAGKKGIEIEGLGPFTAEALFATLTNVNFDAARFPALIKKAVEYRKELESQDRDCFHRRCGNVYACRRHRRPCGTGSSCRAEG